MIMVCD